MAYQGMDTVGSTAGQENGTSSSGAGLFRRAARRLRAYSVSWAAAILCFAACLPQSAVADGVIQAKTLPTWQINVYWSWKSSPPYFSGKEICEAYNAGTTGAWYGDSVVFIPDPGDGRGDCRIYNRDGSVYPWGAAVWVEGSAPYCPANSKSNGATSGSCTCNSGYAPDSAGTACVVAPVDPPGCSQGKDFAGCSAVLPSVQTILPPGTPADGGPSSNAGNPADPGVQQAVEFSCNTNTNAASSTSASAGSLSESALAALMAPGGAGSSGWTAATGRLGPPENAGDPIFPGNGNVFEQELDYAGPSGLVLARSYNSSIPAWSHSWGMRVIASDTAARVIRPDGRSYVFTGSGLGAWTPELAGRGELTRLDGSTGARWQYVALDESTELYDASGALLSITQRGGVTYTAQYNGGQLASISDPFGRRLQFMRDSAGRLSQVLIPEGGVISYGYNTAGYLAQVTYPDGSSRQYLYENATYPMALTGLIDERGVRVSTWTYDARGRGTGSQRAGGVAQYQLVYNADNSVTIVDPLGTSRTQSYAKVGGKSLLAGQSQPCANCSGDTAQRIADPATGLPTQVSDYLGIVTLFTFDARQRPTSVTQAAGRPEQRTRQIQWDSRFHLPVRITQASRSVSFTYDDAGNRTSMTLADDSGASRTWSWIYGANGLAQSMTDPKGGSWKYNYDGSGNMTQAIDPLGRVSTFTYDAGGRVVSQVAPGGLTSTFAYDARGRITSVHSGSEAYAFSYTAAGDLASASLPSGYQVAYSYDAAQRLTAAQDNRGATVAFTLDAAANRVHDEVRDASGNIALATSRVMNVLNRVATVQGAAGQTTAFGYDGNGQLVSQTDPLNHSVQQTLDGLRRPTATTLADNATVSQSWNSLDQLTQVNDPKGVATRYTYNAFGEVTSETSPDIGTLRYTRDAAGAIIRVEDAKGQVNSIERDALGRVTHIVYATNDEVFVTYNAAGFVSKFEDASGTTVYDRDEQGRILRKQQSVNDEPSRPTQLAVSYGYQGGRLASMTYPSGMQVAYRRSAGRVTGIQVQLPMAQSPVAFVSGLNYTALGQPRAWSWSNGDAAARAFDGDGRLTATEFGAYQYDAAGRITTVTQNLWVRKEPRQLQQVPVTWTAGYDARDRLVAFVRDGASVQYSYDANSNRLASVSTLRTAGDFDDALQGDKGRQTVTRTMAVDPASNRLLGVTQALRNEQEGKSAGGVTTQVSYEVDANGALTSDGKHRYEYDAAGRLAKVQLLEDEDSASVTYLHNAIGQRVFKSMRQSDDAEPSEERLGQSFVSWLRTHFSWMFGRSQGQHPALGQLFVYGDGELPGWALLEADDNGTREGHGRTEVIWLPLEGGGAIPVGMYRNGHLYAIHTDHLGTPRLVTDEGKQPVWQWAYSGFGENAPTGVLHGAGEKEHDVLRKTKPEVELNLRFPGQYFDVESGLNYNVNRSYAAMDGRYTQADPIGLNGGLNRYVYVDGSPLMYTDPLGLKGEPVSPNTGSPNSRGPTICTGNDCVTPPVDIPMPEPKKKPWWSPGKDKKDPEMCSKYQPTYATCFACCLRNNALGGNACREQCSHRDPPYPDAPFHTQAPAPEVCLAQ